MQNEYDPNNRRKLVDMPTLSDVTLDKDIKAYPTIQESKDAQPFDPSTLDEVSAESDSESGGARKPKSNRATKN